MTTATLKPTVDPALFGFPAPAFDDNLEMYETIEAGIPLRNLDQLAGFVAPDDKRWKFQIVPSATYDRYKKSGKHLGPEISQKVARLALVVHTACEIFQDTRKARDFLNRPHPLLKGKAPIELALTNESGARAVNDILIAGAYGGGA